MATRTRTVVAVHGITAGGDERTRGYPGDPTKDIRRTEQVFFVMKGGAVFRNDRAVPAR